MNITRRQTLFVSVGAAAFFAMPAFARRLGAELDLEARTNEFTEGAEVVDGDGVVIKAPEIAENGNTVPIEVSAPGASALIVMALGNPNPGVVRVAFGPLAASQSVSTRIRLAGTQDVVAIAKMADGTFQRASATVKVTIGGCGG
ncbi:MAG: thiosulfate oxidation carrier protein SoxY [Silicimonas sp.]|jgi:sulfur-oxidizing protein SoxY|nr:thiosulfate oxidation carrier protein SoxY [Silicimonas sp.]